MEEQKNNGVAAGAAPLPKAAKPVLELPDDLRIPLHTLQADVGYLIGRVAADGSVAALVLESMETRLSHVAEAAYRLNGERADLLAALKAIDALEVMEINPSNYDHEIVCELSGNAVQAALIARAALSKSEV